MCWTVILTTLLEAVDDAAESTVKREERQAEKCRGISDAAVGGVLAIDRSLDVAVQNMDERKVCEFKKIWHETTAWIGKVINDAVEFARTNSPRSIVQLDVQGSIPALSPKKVLNGEIEAMFMSNVWPSLKNRGWKSESVATEDNNKRTHYFFRGTEV
jgi:hypothetical protein